MKVVYVVCIISLIKKQKLKSSSNINKHDDISKSQAQKYNIISTQ